MLGPPSRNHGESYRGGSNSLTCMQNVMAHTLTVQCAGRETRATQLYTEKIVRCILRGITNQMLINNAYGRRYRPKVLDEVDHHKSKSCACVIVNDYECDVNEKTINEQLFINFITQRGGVKVKLRLYPRRGSLLADPDPVRGRLKVKLGCYLRRGCALTDPDSPCLVSVFAMAGADLVIPSAAKGIGSLKSTLSLIKEKSQEHNLPAPFSTYEETNFRGCRDKDIGRMVESSEDLSSRCCGLSLCHGQKWQNIRDSCNQVAHENDVKSDQ